jgi:PE family
MSFVFATPESVAAAASDLANIGSTISSANAAALGPTSGVLAAGADEVSATIAALFDAHSQAYQALSAQAALFHQQFVQLMGGGAEQYALAEAQNASPLEAVGQGVMSGISAPVQAMAEAAPVSNGASATLAAQAGGGSGAFGPGGGGAAGQLVSATAGSGGGSFGIGGAGFTGSLPANGLGASGGAGAAAASAQEAGIGGYGGTPVAAADPAVTPVAAADPGVTPIGAVPAAAPISAPATATARPATPAYSPAAAEPAEE